MTELTPVGLSKDGKTLVLINARGDEFTVAVNTRLRTALQGDHARLGQLEMTMESTLRPRDIQSRIRAGESVEEVAAAAQTSVDKIMGYAGPVLAERAHVAEIAQASSIRPRSADTPSVARTLNDAALPHLRACGLHDSDVVWDAWRRDDGRWALIADYVSKGQPCHAEFSYDQRGRYVSAENDEARLLTGELAAGSGRESTGPGQASGTTQGRRLSAVPSQDELPLGDDAIELVRDHDAESGPAAEVESEPEPDNEPTVEVAREESPAHPKKKGRPSVPSWDEIMFGGGPTE